MTNNRPHRAGIAPVLWFISITFAVTYGIEFALISKGIRFGGEVMQSSPALWLLAVMWVPGLAGLFVSLFVEKRSFKELKDSLSLRFGSLGPYFLTLLIAPLAFAAMYGLSWMAGLTTLDLTMASLTEAIGSKDVITSDMVFKIMLPLSIAAGPFINFIFGLGEEIGWRGFLLPRLMVFGKTKAYLLMGTLWGLWHAPVIWVGFNYPGYPVAGIVMMCVLSTAFGLFINEMTLHYRSVFLAAFIHAAVNAQGYGIWAWIFPNTNPILGGGTGITGILVWLIVGGVTIFCLSRMRPDTQHHLD